MIKFLLSKIKFIFVGAVFLLISISAFLFAGCGNAENTPPINKLSIDQAILGGEVIDSRPEIRNVDVAENLILIDNGVGVDFVVNVLPLIDCEIKIEIADKSIVNFGEQIQNIEGLVGFTRQGNMLYPLNAGETTITVTIPARGGDIVKTCNVLVEKYDEIVLETLQEISNFKSGKKADNSYEIYTAILRSERDLREKQIDIIVSDDLQIIESSKNENFANNEYSFSFDFYFTEGTLHSLKLSFTEDYDNLKTTTYSNQFSISSTPFVKPFNIEVSNDEAEVLRSDEKYLLYFAENISGKDVLTDMNADGYYLQYLLQAISDNGIVKGLQFISSNTNVVKIETVESEGTLLVYAVSVGEGSAVITATANDGSQQFAQAEFVVKDVKPSEIVLKKDSQEVNFINYSSSENLYAALENLIGRQDIYMQNSFGQITEIVFELKISPYYYQKDYIYFESQSAEISIVKDANIVDGIETSTVTISATEAGSYSIDLIIDGNEIYSFTMVVKEAECYIGITNVRYFENVTYNFGTTDKTITVEYLDGPYDNNIYFEISPYSNFGAEWDIDVSISDETIVNRDVTEYRGLFFKILKRGEFTITISEENLGISESIEVFVT